MIDMSVLDGIIRNTRGNLETAMRKGYNQGYHDGQADANARFDQQAYEKGLDDAWEVARKIVLGAEDGGLPNETVDAIFGLRFYQVMRDVTVTEVVAKIREYEQAQAKKRFCNYIQKPCPYEIECDECEVQCSYDRACKRSEAKNDTEGT